ncbi:tyrosinase [Histoplasma capsulatum var. duboisii H88]|uniref:tyrosinase n=1 Tax=Ajellomyces capsulatus (strain H88) TaxID=544711 RepID=F0UV06_AJEC8|nr:tyrosinase [Histoplasma capsulatum var. duboisii H88]QSS51049.1 tyrosinase [Histoplasma capsulatum var. duboisii H88]
MAYKYYPIQGVQEGLGPGSQVPIRRDFNEWSESQERRDQIQVVLFILALREFQATPPDSRDSYFQIAGIHGMPYKSWDEPSLTVQETHRKGYCVHANSLFPIWHRPYLSLYEQRIYEIMVDVIIPGLRLRERAEDEWQEAAFHWRLPFWDWAKNPQIPKLMCFKRIQLRFPAMTVDNPFYKFKMPKGEKMRVYGVGTLKSPDFEDTLEYGECCATSRCPTPSERASTSNAWRDGVVNNETANKFIFDRKSITDFDYGKTTEMVYRLLTYPLDFVSFATTARDATMDSSSASKVINDMNIEFIHNNIHYWVGGDGGHMSQIPVATFDPIFWFHHCFLDRLFAIWQTLNPEKWFTADKTRPFDQKIIGMGNIVTSKAPLRPFHMDEQGTVWTPDGVRDWFKLGYTYPELQRWEYGGDYKDELFRDMNDMYGVLRKEAIEIAKPDSELPGVVDVEDNGVSLNDYAVSIRYSKFAMGGNPFNLEVYLRPENETENTFRQEDFVTSAYNFSQPAEQNGDTVCSNCSDLEEQDVQVIAYIPITPYLIKKIEQQVLQNLEPANIERFLSGMYYRITMAGNTVPEERWKPTMNLKISVSRTRMRYSNDPSIITRFDDPETIPSLGIDTEIASVPATISGGITNHVSFDNITQLEEAVPVGGSLVISSSHLNPDIPSRENLTGISLANVDPRSSNANNHESYDIPVCIIINSRRNLLSYTSKHAGRGFSALTDLQLPQSQWFQKDNPCIRVDVGADDFVVYVDGRKIQAVERTIKSGNITHVRYWTSNNKAPALANDITVTTYKQASMIQSVIKPPSP